MLKRGVSRKAERARRESPQALHTALKDLFDRLGFSRKMSEISVIVSWPQLVGNRIAQVTVAERIENGVLFVKTATAPWRQELTLRRMEIRDRINKALGGEVVKEIRFR